MGIMELCPTAIVTLFWPKEMAGVNPFTVTVRVPHALVAEQIVNVAVPAVIPESVSKLLERYGWMTAAFEFALTEYGVIPPLIVTVVACPTATTGLVWLKESAEEAAGALAVAVITPQELMLLEQIVTADDPPAVPA